MSAATSPPAGRCPRCGLEMSPDVAGGRCPACLLAVALEPASDFNSQAETVLPPTSASDTTGRVAPRLAPGQAFGPYRIVRLLGRGGMGEVYEAEHVEQGRRVALKVLSQRLTDPHDRARFLREGQLAASINHPHSVYIFGSEEIAGTPVISMELLAGGTLKDRVREQGPLQPAEAVDVILQIIAGLDAAQAGGVLHRDIKPANCFIASDGTVKVGDFGLSISTMARDVSQLTKSGTFQGTPQFAAPEQIKGDPLDVRADIYAVGATLYSLLTGQPPFADEDLLALVTRIATEVPRSPRALQPRVPRGLAKVVLRCLAKDRASRPATYAALDEALRPFSSAAPTAATLGSRLAAGVIDQVLVLFFLNLVLGLIRAISGDLRAGSTWSALPTALLIGTYFTLTEGLTGASVGKRIVGLRVIDVQGGRPGLVRASVRSAIFVCAARWPYQIPNSLWIRVFLPATATLDPMSRAATSGELIFFLTVLFQFAPLALFLPARARNGFAGIHELVSGTRVIASAREARAHVPWDVLSDRFSTDPARSDERGFPTRGPFLLLEPLASAASASVALGFDPALKRHVWIREAPPGTPLSDAARRDVARPGRLRWLAGQHTPNGTWEAFEAPRGASLLSRAVSNQPWRAVRQWLADLAEELVQCEREGHMPALGLDHVWITTEDRAKLLDFPAPGATPRETAAVIGDTDSPTSRVQAFLGSVAWSGLLGRVQGAADALPIIEPPLPLSGTAVLRVLQGPPGAARPEELLNLCRVALQTRSSVPRWSRALVPALIAAVLTAFTVSVASFRFGSERLIQVFGVGTADVVLFNSLIDIDRLRRSDAPASDTERRALEMYIAGVYAPLSSRPSKFVWALRPYRQLVNNIAARHPTVSNADLLAALEQLGPERLKTLNREPAADGVAVIVLLPALMLLPVIVGFAYFSLVLAFALRGGLILRLFRLALVDVAGNEVARWRALWRAALAWMPLIGLQLLADRAIRALWVYSADIWMMVGALSLVMAIGICWAIVVPARGLPDRIAGTWLVPR